jgi:hypothetical protein
MLAMQIRPLSRRGKQDDWFIFNVLIPLLFFCSALLLMPTTQVFQFDTDEGIELMKAVLYGQGLQLYTQIWNEQPPLFTVLLSYWLKGFGHSILAARLLTLCFGTALVWSFCQILRLFLGNAMAVIGVLMLALSCNFLRTSVSVMIGLPSVALAVVAIYLLLLYQQKARLGLLVLSGIFFGLSLQTKLFTAFLIPILLVHLITFSSRRNKLNVSISAFVPLLVWLGSCLLAFGVTGLAFGSLINFKQLILPNFGLNDIQAFQERNNLLDLITLFLQDFDYLLLATVGVVLILKAARWQQLLPLAWLAVISLILLNHKPIWWHYYLLLSIPVTWLAVYGVQRGILSLQQERWLSQFKGSQWKQPTLSLLAGVCLIFSILVVPIKLTVLHFTNQGFIQDSAAHFEVVKQLRQHQDSTRWLFTDLPAYAFYADLKVPPEIAVFAGKRWSSGNLSPRELHTVLETYRPEQVVLGRFPEVKAQLSSYIDEHYSKRYERDGVVHYVIKSEVN